nr:LysM domain-containing protein [Thermoanaerobaculia bacterium]
ASTTVPAPTGEAAPTPANPGVVPAEPLAAQSAPATAAQALPEFHVVAAGETLFGIARRYGVSVQALQRANGLGRKGVIYPGQKLKLER